MRYNSIRTKLDNPILLFIILFFVISVNIIATVNFLLITFAGVLFLAFHTCLKNRYLYSLFFVVFTFLIVEINSGLAPFSLTLLSLFIYTFIIPKEDEESVYFVANSYVYMIFFYIGLLILWAVFYGISQKVVLALFLNLLIDFLFFGMFIWT